MTHDTIADIAFVTLTLLIIVALSSVTALAGAPDRIEMDAVHSVPEPADISSGSFPYAAEIRNAASVRADHMDGQRLSATPR